MDSALEFTSSPRTPLCNGPQSSFPPGVSDYNQTNLNKLHHGVKCPSVWIDQNKQGWCKHCLSLVASSTCQLKALVLDVP